MKDIRENMQKEMDEQEIEEVLQQEGRSMFPSGDVEKCKAFLSKIEKFAIISDYHSDFYSVFQGFWAGNVE